MRGMDRRTGRALSGRAHLEQSVEDILTTPIGQRVMNRDYGSRLFDLIDVPINQFTKVDFYAAIIEALIRWEPRLRITKATVSSPEAGCIEVGVSGVEVASGRDITIAGIEIA